MRPRALAVCLALICGSAACSSTRDVYLGSDFPAAGTSAEPHATAGEPEPPAQPDAGTPREPEAGASAAESCAGMRLDCDGNAANGCETEGAVDRNHCGRCGNACAASDCACVGGRLVATCSSGRGDCDADARNGCEVDVDTSMQHCGRCQRACHTNGHDAISAVCSGGHCRITCEAEAFPEGDCDDNPDNGCETQLWANDMHCGACGVRCSCLMGACL